MFGIGRTSGVWGRTPGLPSGQPQSVTGGTEAARFEIGNDGTLLPLASFAQSDWRVSDRPAASVATPQVRYTTLEAVKLSTRSPSSREAASWEAGEWDEQLIQAIVTAEDQIDSLCGRTFDVAPQVATVREYQVLPDGSLDTDDFVGEAVITMDGQTVSTSRWSAEFAVGGNRNVYRGIRSLPTSLSYNSRFIRDLPLHSGWEYEGPLPTYEVSARWGWDAVPAAVSYATRLIAGRLFKRPADAALGVMSVGGDPVYLTRFDPDVEASLSKYRLFGSGRR